MNKKMSKEIEDNWQNIWRDILEKPDGSINIEQLKLELMDYSDMIDRMTMLTCEITAHKLSYPTYPVETILEVMREAEQDHMDDQKQEDQEYGFCHFCEQKIGNPSEDE